MFFFLRIVSGEAVTEPVVSKLGHVYERRLIIKHLHDSGGKCPITGAPLAEEDLIAIQGGD
jgi:pre-mRNA-processing factor 19